MSTDQSLDARVAAYLGDGPTDLPLEERERIARLTAGVSQRRPWLDGVGAGGQRWVGAVAGSALTLAAVLVVVSGNLLPLRPGGAASSPATTTHPPVTLRMPSSVELAPGRYDVRMHVRIELTVGAGWYVQDNGQTITRHSDDKLFPRILVLWPTEIATDVCAGAAARPIVPAGEDLTRSDFAAAIESLTGIAREGPLQAQVGNLPALKYVLTLAPTCDQPDIRWVMGGDPDVLMGAGGTLTLYVIDVDREGLVIAVPERGSTPDEVAMIDAVLASMYIWNDSP